MELLFIVGLLPWEIYLEVDHSQAGNFMQAKFQNPGTVVI